MVVSVFSGAVSAERSPPGSRRAQPHEAQRSGMPDASAGLPERTEDDVAEARLFFNNFNHNNIASEQLIINCGNAFFLPLKCVFFVPGRIPAEKGDARCPGATDSRSGSAGCAAGGWRIDLRVMKAEGRHAVFAPALSGGCVTADCENERRMFPSAVPDHAPRCRRSVPIREPDDLLLRQG